MLAKETIALCSFPLLSLACGGGGSTTPGGDAGPLPLVTGFVRSPAGQAIDSTLGKSRIARGETHGVELPGDSPVPDFTEVELLRVDPSGSVLSIIARGATVNGRYSFDLDALNQSYSTQLVVRAGSGASEMRALAIGFEVDVDSLSEAVTRLLLQQAGRLDRLTLQEVDDTQRAVQFLTVTNNLVAQADVASTVALLNQVIFAEQGLLEYVNAASSPGQTDVGPGDMGNYFPIQLGDTWVLRGARSVDGGRTEAFDTARRLLVLDGGQYSVATSSPPDSRMPHFEFMEKTTAGILNLGSSDPHDPLQDFTPYELVHFPIRFQAGRVLFEASDLPAGRDFDGDGIEDRMDVEARELGSAIEDVTTTIGSFPRCLRLQYQLETTLHRSGGGLDTSQEQVTRWYAPGLGLLREQGRTTTRSNGEALGEETYSQSLQSYASGESGVGLLPPLTLAQGIANGPEIDRPGRPAIGFDGNNHFVVTCREQQGVTQLTGTIVGPKGLAELEVPIVTLLGPECRPEPAVAFAGAYLVTYVERSAGSSRIRGVRVTRSGQVLDPGGFDISSGPVDGQPTVAFDEIKYTVVWRREVGEQEGELFGTFVTTEGGVLPEFSLHEAPGDQREPDLAFGNGANLCVWSDAFAGVTEIRATRFDTLGAILGEPGVLLAEASGAEGDREPEVAFDGTIFLAAWLRTTSEEAGLRHIVAARMSVGGLQPDAEPLSIRALDVRNESLSLDYDGENFACVWETRSAGDSAGIHLARISAEGLLLDGSPTGPARRLARQPASGLLSHPMARMAGRSGERGGLIAWLFTAKNERKLEGLRAFSF